VGVCALIHRETTKQSAEGGGVHDIVVARVDGEFGLKGRRLVGSTCRQAADPLTPSETAQRACGGQKC
jgi:hypothetical protein